MYSRGMDSGSVATSGVHGGRAVSQGIRRRSLPDAENFLVFGYSTGTQNIPHSRYFVTASGFTARQTRTTHSRSGQCSCSAVVYVAAVF